MDNNSNGQYAYSGALVNGFLMWGIILLLVLAAAGLFLTESPVTCVLGVIVAAVAVFCMAGFLMLEPNQACVMIFFGKYRGTFRGTGYFWVNPFMNKKKVSLRIRNMDIAPIKVNDKIGNPVMIGMVLVWKVNDTYRAVFDVDAADTPSITVSSDGKIKENLSLIHISEPTRP